MSNRDSIAADPLEGAGPFRFDNDSALAPGEYMYLDFRNMERNGRKGGYRKHLPFDQITVTNMDSANRLDYTINGVFDGLVVPNAAETFDQAGVINVRIAVPESGSEVSAGDITVECLTEPYGADDRARERKRQGTVSSMVEKFTGVKF